MKKVYEAVGERKRFIIECNNDYRAAMRFIHSKNEIGIKDFLLVGSINKEELDTELDIKWCLNGLLPEKYETEEITIVEPLEKHYGKKLIKIHEIDTRFNGTIELSDKAIVLNSVKLYDEMIKDEKYKNVLDKLNVVLYEGEKDLALKMLCYDKNYAYMDLNENGYALDKKNHEDIIDYNYYMIGLQDEIEEKIENGTIEEFKVEKRKRYVKDIKESNNFKIISGLTKNDEGNIKLDDDMQATTDIGKWRENQEDAILLIKDEKIPNFKMMVVADGVGGSEYGEFASHIIIEELKYWFENLSEEEKQSYYTGIEKLKESLFDVVELKIQPRVQYDTLYYGASTLVCAIVGKNDTLVSNVGDSRAYIVRNGKLIQVSREDTVSHEKFKNGELETKEEERFDPDSNRIIQCIGMNRNQLNHPHCEIIDNKDYDMLLLFTDGVTDCLSDDDIAVACRTTDRKELANKIVEKAIRHDSMIEEKYYDEKYDNKEFMKYIPGGKDNTTAVTFIPKKDEEERE